MLNTFLNHLTTPQYFWGLVFLCLAFCTTLVGGVIGIWWKDKKHITLGFTGGVLIGVVAFELLPEIFEMVTENDVDIHVPMIALVVGFFLFHIAEKLFLVHHAHEEHYEDHKHPTVGMISAIALIIHSGIDGMGIGLGFQISLSAGIAVAIAILAHDFSDGLNTVSLMTVHGNEKKRVWLFLLLDAVAPIVGGVSVLFFTASPVFLLAYLGFFAGFLLYISASDILPEAHSNHSSKLAILMTFVGVLFMYVVGVVGH
ncbi:MAG: ZIP family metal transporter [Candidatus Taylorbacteria bacterium]|nr:ZIP family metal transporter [Candidatus Taylorbacteria bacterium]